MPYCSRCGQQVDETALFCSNCGAPLKQQTQTGQSVSTPYGPFRRGRLGPSVGNRGRLCEIVDRFLQKGATSPEKRARKKVEVKWAVYHFEDNFTRSTEGIPFWGWGFSMGKQFIERKFDYCVLLAAKRDGAEPSHIFVLRVEEMKEGSMGGKRRSAVYTKGSYFIEFSENKNFYFKRKWHPKGPSEIEKSLFNIDEHIALWGKLKSSGFLE